MGIIWTHQVAFAADLGFGEALGAFVFGLTGVMAAVGRFGGFLVDRFGREITFTIASALTVLGTLALLVVANFTHVWILYLYGITFGLGLGLIAPAYSSTAADLFSGTGFGSILGFVNIGWGVGSGVGAWLGGIAFDYTGSYILAIIVAMICLTLMCLFIWLAAPRRIRRIAKVG
jgi:MFS family permease